MTQKKKIRKEKRYPQAQIYGKLQKITCMMEGEEQGQKKWRGKMKQKTRTYTKSRKRHTDGPLGFICRGETGQCSAYSG